MKTQARGISRTSILFLRNRVCLLLPDKVIPNRYIDFLFLFTLSSLLSSFVDILILCRLRRLVFHSHFDHSILTIDILGLLTRLKVPISFLKIFIDQFLSLLFLVFDPWRFLFLPYRNLKRYHNLQSSVYHLVNVKTTLLQNWFLKRWDCHVVFL